MPFVVTPAIRLSELLAGLSLVADLGMGNPPEEAMRATLLAIGLAREAGSTDADVMAVYYTTLLRYIGCHSYAHEESEIFGDDIAVRAGGARVDFGNPREVLSFFIHGVGRDEPPLRRARTVASAIASGKRFGTGLARAYCEVGAVPGSYVVGVVSAQPPSWWRPRFTSRRGLIAATRSDRPNRFPSDTAVANPAMSVSDR